MSMSVGGTDENEPIMEMNTTPLIDVMLVLLVYLILSLPPSTHAVKLDMPQGHAIPPPVPPEVITLEVDFDGTYIWNGTSVSDLTTLESYFKRAAKQIPQPELHIQPNKRVKYNYVALALAVAQRNEITRIGFVGNEQYIE